jgi:hypothetical protein
VAAWCIEEVAGRRAIGSVIDGEVAPDPVPAQWTSSLTFPPDAPPASEWGDVRLYWVVCLLVDEDVKALESVVVLGHRGRPVEPVALDWQWLAEPFDDGILGPVLIRHLRRVPLGRFGQAVYDGLQVPIWRGVAVALVLAIELAAAVSLAVVLYRLNVYSEAGFLALAGVLLVTAVSGRQSRALLTTVLGVAAAAVIVDEWTSDPRSRGWLLVLLAGAGVVFTAYRLERVSGIVRTASLVLMGLAAAATVLSFPVIVVWGIAQHPSNAWVVLGVLAFFGVCAAISLRDGA